MKSSWILACATVLAFVFIASADAGTIMQPGSTGTLSWTGDTAFADMTFNKFDTSVGTLNSVSFVLKGTVTAKFEFEESTAKLVKADIGSTMTLNAVGGPQDLVTAIPTVRFTYRVPANTSGSGAASETDTAFGAITDPVDAAYFTGTGTLQLRLDALKTKVTSGASFPTLDNASQADVTLIYDYTPVPEPATLVGLASLGLMGAAACVLRKKRR